MRIKTFFIIHILSSFSLLYIGEYIFTILIQSLLFLMFFRNYNYFYISALHLNLVLLFSSMEYELYFLNLFLYIYCFFRYRAKILKNKLFLYVLGFILISIVYKFLDNFFFELEMLFGIVDSVNYVDNVSLSTLTLLHIIIFYFVILLSKKFDIIDKKY